jgi:hypothetical protein
MSSRHYFSAQTTRGLSLDDGENAVAHFQSMSAYQVEPKRLFPSSIVLECSHLFGSTQEKGIGSSEAP